MPLTVHIAASHSFTITRRRAERGLMVGSMMLAVWRLWRDMGAATEAIGTYLYPFGGTWTDLGRRAIAVDCTRRRLPRRAIDQPGTRDAHAG
jgi:hypothetical protein